MDVALIMIGCLAVAPLCGWNLEAIKKRTNPISNKESTMQWTKPQFTDLRFGFEITMYIANR